MTVSMTVSFGARPERRWEPPNVLRPLGTITTWHRGQEIYAPGDTAEKWYCVVLGLARKYALEPSGRRHIVDFLLPGDFFGLTARDHHFFAVDAVSEGTLIACYPRRRVEMTAASDPALGRLLREVGFAALSRLQARILVLARITAAEKVGSFLVEMEERLSSGRAEVVALPISRYDIADYLGLSVETVSRVLTGLEHSGAIRFSGKREFRIVDRRATEQPRGRATLPK